MTPNGFGDRVAIIGLGLIGGSLARALGRLARPPEIVGWSRNVDELERARDDGVIRTAVTEPRAALHNADLVVYGTPVGATLEFMREHRGAWSEGAVIMDVGSVKREIMERARALALNDRFIGAHPMAGAERSGYAASRANLFDGARVWICVGDSASTESRALAFWYAVGGEPARIDPADHDQLMARVSHLPQMLASALALALEAGNVMPDDLGPGARDMTRLAGSAPGLWTDLLLRNTEALAGPLTDIRSALDALAGALEAGDTNELNELLAGARRWRKGPA